MALYSDVTVTNLPKSKIRIKGVISLQAFEIYRAKAVRALNQEVEVPGFRKGNVPESVLIDRFGEIALGEEVAELALRDVYPDILEEHEIQPIGRPDIKILKLVIGEPIAFSAETAILPKIALPDYKTEAHKIFSKMKAIPEVTENEIDNAILNMRKNFARTKKREDTAPRELVEYVGDEKLTESDLPKINTLVDMFQCADVAEFREKIKHGLYEINKTQVRDNARLVFLEGLLKSFKSDLPDILVDHEMYHQTKRFENEIVRSGSNLNEYLAQSGSSKENFLKQFRASAERNVQAELMFEEIAHKENLHPSQEKIRNELNKTLDYYKDDEKINKDALENHINVYLTNDAVWKYLEKATVE